MERYGDAAAGGGPDAAPGGGLDAAVEQEPLVLDHGHEDGADDEVEAANEKVC